MAGLISKGITLGYCATSTGEFTSVNNVIDIPDLGGSTDSIEVTTLSDEAHLYIPGLKDYGDSLDFTILHDKTQFSTLKGLEGTTYYWKVSIPDGASGAISTVASFSGRCTVKLNGTTYNESLKDTLSIKPESPISFA